jgi:hypothetical protein
VRKKSSHQSSSCLAFVRRFPPAILPAGRWGPQHLKVAYGPLRSSICSGKEQFTFYRVVIAMLVGFVAGIPAPADWGTQFCIGMWVVLALIQGLVVVFLAVVRPARVPFSDTLMAVGSLVTAALQVSLMSVSLSTLDDGGDIPSSQQALFQQASLSVSILSVLTTLMSIVKTIHMVLVRLWEHQFSSIMTPTAVTTNAANNMNSIIAPSHPSSGIRARRMSVVVVPGGSVLKRRDTFRTFVTDAFFLLTGLASSDGVVFEDNDDSSGGVEGRQLQQRRQQLDRSLPWTSSPRTKDEVLRNLAVLIESSCAKRRNTNPTHRN